MGFKKLINSNKALSLVAAFMLLGTNVLMAQGTGADPKAADSTSKADMWLGVGYYVLLVLLACFIVAVVGKILKVYDLSLQMQGKKGMNWNNIIGVICIIFLVVSLYGVYWSFTVQGNMILPESASAHGGKIGADAGHR